MNKIYNNLLEAQIKKLNNAEIISAILICLRFQKLKLDESMKKKLIPVLVAEYEKKIASSNKETTNLSTKNNTIILAATALEALELLGYDVSTLTSFDTKANRIMFNNPISNSILSDKEVKRGSGVQLERVKQLTSQLKLKHKDTKRPRSQAWSNIKYKEAQRDQINTELKSARSGDSINPNLLIVAAVRIRLIRAISDEILDNEGNSFLTTNFQYLLPTALKLPHAVSSIAQLIYLKQLDSGKIAPISYKAMNDGLRVDREAKAKKAAEDKGET